MGFKVQTNPAFFVRSAAVLEPLEGRLLMSAAAGPGVYAPGSTARGTTLSDWSAQWWQWALSLPLDANPLTDETGAQAFRGDVGKVFFLGGVFNESGTAERTITVPTGTPLFFPALNSFSVNIPGFGPELTEEQLRADAASLVVGVTNLHATIDGEQVPDLASHRELSPTFTAVLPEDSLLSPFGVDYVGETGMAVSDGYWVMTRPLRPGDHEISFGGTTNEGTDAEFTLDVTYHVTVVPAGQYRKSQDPAALPESVFGSEPIAGTHDRATDLLTSAG
jgi:hypothetical protein